MMFKNSEILSYQKTEMNHLDASLYPVKNGHSEKHGDGFYCRSRGKSGFNTGTIERTLNINSYQIACDLYIYI